nr:disulfide bond formation protein DsbA [Candidatus Dadabacteria bacterium]
MNNKVIISYFFDILCIWSYISQIRVNELKNKLGENIKINYHFITIFGCTENRINKQWQDKGGYAGFGDYVQKTCKDFPHV